MCSFHTYTLRVFDSHSFHTRFLQPRPSSCAPAPLSATLLPQAFEQVLAIHPEWRGKLVLVQVTSAARWAAQGRAAQRSNAGPYLRPAVRLLPSWSARIAAPPCIHAAPFSLAYCRPALLSLDAHFLLRRAPGKDVEELQRFVLGLVEHINAKYRQPG